MKSLTKEEKDIILDFYFQCGTKERIDRARDLIANDERAAKLFAKLGETLDQLGHVKEESCPEDLADITVARLKLAASAERTRESVEIERAEPAATAGSGHRFLGNLVDMAAVAAILVAFVSLSVPALTRMRHASWEKSCRDNLRYVGAGLASYAESSDGAAPCFGSAAGQNPWWKVGDEGEQKNSNTQPVWVLVKKGYVMPEKLICPARPDHEGLDIPKAQYAKLSDFPDRKNLSYSFAFMCEKKATKAMNSRFVLFGDRNPIFESVVAKDKAGKYVFSNLVLDDEKRQAMSQNHFGKGQNLLFGDMSVTFDRDRLVNGDDIYTVSGVDTYTGLETPESADDIFLVP